MLSKAEYFVKQNAVDVPEVYDAVMALRAYILKDGYHETKAARLDEWVTYEGNLFELVIGIFTICLQGQQTYQSLIGVASNRIPMKKKLDRIQTIAEVIAVIGQTGLIRITKMGEGKSIMIDTEYTLTGIPSTNKHEIVFKAPELITKNYTEEEGSMLLGSSFNYHDEDICLDHINRMNSTELKLNIPFLCKVKEEPKNEPETPDQQRQWAKHVKDSRAVYMLIGRKTFYQLHKDDSRGRSYACGYHVNYQGSSFKKAIVQLANPEVIPL